MPERRRTLSGLERLLRELGFTYYESRALAFLSLVRGGVRVRDVSEATGIPRTKLYEVIRSLEESGLVEVSPGRPMIVSAPPPDMLPTILFERVISDTARKVSLLTKAFHLQMDEGVWLMSRVTLPLRGEDSLEKVSHLVLEDSRDFLIMAVTKGSVHLVPTGLAYRNASLIVDVPKTYEELERRGLTTKNVRTGNRDVFGFVTERAGLLASDDLRTGIYSTEPGLMRAIAILLRALYSSSPRAR